MRITKYRNTNVDPELVALPERRLLAAVLGRAIIDYVGDIENITQLETREAWAWLFNSERKDTFSFMNCCNELDICPYELRKKIKKVKANKSFNIHIKKIYSGYRLDGYRKERSNGNNTSMHLA